MQGIPPKWTTEQQDFLKAQWGKMTQKEIAEILGMSKNNIITKARHMNLPNKKQQWTEQWKKIDEILAQYKDEYSYPEIEKLTGIPSATLQKRASKLKLTTQQTWTKEELAILDANMDKSTEWLSAHINRPVWGIEAKRRLRPGYKSLSETRAETMKNRKAFITAHIGIMTQKQMAAALGISKSCLEQTMKKLKITCPKKDDTDIITYLTKNKDQMTYKEMSKASGFSEKDLKRVAYKYQIRKTIRQRSIQTAKKDAEILPYIKAHINELGAAGCAAALNLPVYTITNCAKRHGIRQPYKKK